MLLDPPKAIYDQRQGSRASWTRSCPIRDCVSPSQATSNASPTMTAITDRRTMTAAVHHCQSPRLSLPGGFH